MDSYPSTALLQLVIFDQSVSSILSRLVEQTVLPKHCTAPSMNTPIRNVKKPSNSHACTIACVECFYEIAVFPKEML